VRAILLGPQRRPTLDAVVRSSVPGEGPIATVTAGWQEREPYDGELNALLDRRGSGLALYRRWLDVQEQDPEFAAAERALQRILGELADLYLLRLDYALQAVYALQHRPGVPAEAVAEAVEGVQSLDAAHLARVNEVRGEFFDRVRPHDRPVIAAHRLAVAGLLGEAAALVVAGGHVGVLADVLHLFNVAAALPTGAVVIAWSAGAMALADRIVLFHDRSPLGPGHSEVYGSGLSVVRDVVLLPHARARLLLDDTPRMAVFAQRFAPALCLPLEAGTRVALSGSGSGSGSGALPAGGLPAGTRVLGEDGHVTAVREAA
jgi:hypothetical protein